MRDSNVIDKPTGDGGFIDIFWPGFVKVVFFSGVSLRWADALKWVVEFAVACCVESPVVVAALVFVDGLIRAVSLGRF